MNTVERNKKLIKDLLISSIKNNEFFKYVLMMPNYCVETRDLNGFVKPNRYYTMEAIYEYHRENPNLKLDEMLSDTLIDISKQYKGEQAIEAVLETIEYHLTYDNTKQSIPFNIGCQSILDELKKGILKNKEMYLQPKECFNNIPFWNTIEHYNLLLKEKFALSLL